MMMMMKMVIVTTKKEKSLEASDDVEVTWNEIAYSEDDFIDENNDVSSGADDSSNEKADWKAFEANDNNNNLYDGEGIENQYLDDDENTNEYCF